jgi:hypothetical protein
MVNLALKLKEGTKKAHTAAENVGFVLPQARRQPLLCLRSNGRRDGASLTKPNYFKD